MKVKVIDIDGYLYTLKDIENNVFKMNIEFIDFIYECEIGDYLVLSKEILREKNLFNFKVVEFDSNLKLIKDDVEYMLERVYG